MCPGEEPIAAYAAGRLDRAERDAIDLHLDACSACSELVAMLAKLGGSAHVPASTIGAASDAAAADPDRLLDGQLGRYLLLARIGAGGMGVVYAAYDPELDRRVALKLLRRSSPGDELRREARAIARLAHPNVVAVHDAGRVDDVAFVAMEYVDGVTLRDWLARARKPAQIVDAFIQAGRGLAAAHAAGVVHRDIKPSNILIGHDGRARICDFGLASPTALAGGTPGYIAPEQAQGEPVDARADQYAFCVALWEALAGDRPATAEAPRTGMLIYVSDRVVAALRRGLAREPERRFASMDELLSELGAPPSRRHVPWLIVAGAVLAGTLGLAIAGAVHEPLSPCSGAGDPIARLWADPQRAAVRAAFGKTGLPFAATTAATTISHLDAWTARWTATAVASCRATEQHAQPAQLHALRQGCLDALAEQLAPIAQLAQHADAGVVTAASALLASLPAPERCDDVALLGGLPPLPPGEDRRGEVAAVRARAAELEARLIAGKTAAAAAPIAALRTRADATGYAPLRARAAFLSARLANARTQFALAIGELHAAARLATSARDLEMLAEIWTELVKSLGNDPRTGDQATVFDGYVEALIPQLPDHDVLAQQLEHARCTRNASGAAEVSAAAHHCELAIAQAERMHPPALEVANAELTRLGHFQRMLGDGARALATLRRAVADATRVFGADHPETAIARYALGIAELDGGDTEHAIAELRGVLAIRRRAYPDGGPAVAEALQGLGDALASAEHHAEALPLFEEGLAILDRAGAADSAEAINLHILAGMSLEELHRDDEALVHDRRAADLGEHSLEHREHLAAMALRLAAGIDAHRGHPASALVEAERALRVLERGHPTAADLGKTQLVIAQLAAATGDRTRAHAIAETAVATLATAGPAGAEDLAEATALVRTSQSSAMPK